ncbi:MAG TPA: TfoX/Sxy family protein [Thermoanaerobaculia bacterium]|nr:TfoX/Sxy family protein [Thermoanaerobaculia bacterium]
MPKWKAAPPELTTRFAEMLEAIPDAEPKKMFGYLAGFTGGNMFAGIFQDSIILRLPEAERLALQKIGGKPFEPMPGRPMREYVVAPATTVAATAELVRWLKKAHAYAASLPPKNKAKKPAHKKRK